MEIIDGEAFTVSKFEANLKTGPDTQFDGQTWLDNAGLEFLPDRVEIIWSRKGGLRQLVIAAVGGDGVKRDGQLSRVKRWRRYGEEDMDAAPSWLKLAVESGPAYVYDSLRGLS
ncbi:MAG TPA: hypothetical protein VGH72_33595 [Pseudonocardia sp.]|jgi:hypothetical protein